MTDRRHKQTDSLETWADRSESYATWSAGAGGPEQGPPPALLEQLDLAAERLQELERWSMELSLGVDPTGRARCSLRQGSRTREIGLRRLLVFLSGDRRAPSYGIGVR